MFPFTKNSLSTDSVSFSGAVVSSVTIKRLTVPEIINYGYPAELDCEFALEDNYQDLVVKWFLNQNMVYQWIPGKSSNNSALPKSTR